MIIQDVKYSYKYFINTTFFNSFTIITEYNSFNFLFTIYYTLINALS